MIVSNSSPIIILGKQGILELLKRCFKKVIIPKSAYEEIMQKKDSTEVIALNKAINDGWIIVKEIDINSILQTKNIGQGEKEAISLAAKYKSILFIDDDIAKKYASLLNVECHGALYVVYLSVLKRFINKQQAKNIFENMIKDGFYVSTEIYAKFLEFLDKL